MGSEYLCHLTFTLSKFTLKKFLFLEMVSDTMMSPSIFLYYETPSWVFEDFLCFFFHCRNLACYHTYGYIISLFLNGKLQLACGTRLGTSIN